MSETASCSKTGTEQQPNEQESTLLSLSLDLTHPEILPCSTLRSLIKERGLGSENVDSMDKTALVQHFHKTLLPLPQRKYRLNRKGTELAAKQEARKRASSTDEESNPRPLKRLPDVNSRVNGSRIISLKKDTSDMPKPNNVIGLKSVEGSKERSDNTAKGSRVIKLINRTLQSEVDKSNGPKTPCNTSNSTSSQESKPEAKNTDTPTVKKHARITWP